MEYENLKNKSGSAYSKSQGPSLPDALFFGVTIAAALALGFAVGIRKS
jgi:hypothetical protein